MTHNISDSAVKNSTNRPNEVVNDYLLIPQENQSKRPGVYLAGDIYTSLTTTRETEFDFNFFDFFLPIGGGPSPHVHLYESEVWHIIDGQIQFNLGNQGNDSLILPEGTTILGPRDRVHGFKNLASTVSILANTPGARTLSMTTPGSLGLLFDASSTIITDRDAPVPSFADSFIRLTKVAKYGGRLPGNGVIFKDFGLDPNYEAPEDSLNYVIVLPENVDEALIKEASRLAELNGFSIWTAGDQGELPQRPTFIGQFGIEYTSLISLEESGNEFSYNQFSLEPQEFNISNSFIQANLKDNQVVKPTKSQATGVATLQLNSEGEIEYSLTVTGLDFGILTEGGTPQTADINDDVTAIHIHDGERGTNGSHVFDILDQNKQDENELNITLNQDTSTTLSGTWNHSEKEISRNLVDFFGKNLLGAESNFYFQIHTKGNPTGEIRGQITRTTSADNFSDLVQSEDHQLFYVKEGQLSLRIGDEVRIAEEDTFVYIAPGNEYSIANFGNETVESLSVTVINKETPFPSPNELFPSPLNPQKTVSDKNLVFLSDKADFFGDWLAQKNGSSRRIYGGGGNDEIFTNVDDRAFGEDGDDLLDASSGGGRNLLDGGEGNDFLLAGSNDQLVGGEGDDFLDIRYGSNNRLYGGSGADNFRIVNRSLPYAIEVQYLQDPNQFLPDNLSVPDLVDTKNTIMDFELGVDKIHIVGIKDIVSSFDELELLPALGDLGSTSVIANFIEDGVEKDISLVNIAGVIFNELSANDFFFG